MFFFKNLVRHADEQLKPFITPHALFKGKGKGDGGANL